MFVLDWVLIVENNTSTIWKKYRRLSTMANVVRSVNKDGGSYG